VGDGVRGSGVAKTEARDVGAFQTIVLEGAEQLTLTTGPLGQLRITADDNLLPLIETTVKDGKLVVRETKKVQTTTPITMFITAPSVAEIDSRGAGSVRAMGLGGPSFALKSFGAASADLAGQVEHLEIEVAGAGKVGATGLVAKDAHVSISGAGSVEVNATDKLKADVSGVGAVRYRGSPTVEKTVTGVGSVSALQ
jgi:hypothetical protein